MTPMRPITMLLSCAIAGFVASATLAQATNYTSVEATAGKPVQLIYDPSNSMETVLDRLGNPTTYVYDNRGNILTEIDARGGITRRTYDVNNNLLTQSDPLSAITTRIWSGSLLEIREARSS